MGPNSQPTSHQTVLTRLLRTHALPTLASKATLSTRQAGQFNQLAWQIGRSAVVKIPLWFELAEISSRMRAVVKIDLSNAYSNISFNRCSVAATPAQLFWSIVT